jgi:hypothetical protein
MVKSVLKLFIIVLLISLLISCNQIIDFEEKEPVEEQQEQLAFNEDLAFEAVSNYYAHLVSKRYAMALFHIDYAENPSDTVMDLEALNFFDDALSYSVDQFEVDPDRTIVRDNVGLFIVQITISYDNQEERKVIERVQVSQSGDLFKIINIQSWDMFLPHRSFNFEIDNPR